MPEALANARSRMAVESRMSPLFVHDPRRGETLAERFSLDGNPDSDQPWTTTTIDYLDETRTLQLLTVPLTPADFALGEVRFAKQFRWLAVHEEAAAVPIADYVELPPEQRVGKIPFVYTTDDRRQLVRMACSNAIVNLVEDRRRHWQLLQFLSGQSEAALSAEHRTEVDALTNRYSEAIQAREASWTASSDGRPGHVQHGPGGWTAQPGAGSARRTRGVRGGRPRRRGAAHLA